jgi:NADH-ubiquinone oxidoreductase chain 5
MLIFFIFLPLCVSIKLIFFGNILGKRLITTLALFFVVIQNLLIWSALIRVILTKQLLVENWPWLQVHNIIFEISAVGDFLALSMSLLVITITSCIIIYSLDYIKEDPSFIRFISYLFLFLFSMLFMINAGNYIQFFIGWEYVGLTSYLLINFWYTRNEANKGGLKAIIYNRIGDIAFLCALAYMYIIFGTFKFSIIFSVIPDTLNLYLFNLGFIKFNSIDIIALLLMFAAMAKSAQLFLHSWLVDAMEGPTPVSALLHSATMVTAGIFLLLRSNKIYSYSPNISIILILIGTITMFISSIVALSQNDIKRVVAFSTCSQLGLMMISLGFHCFTATYFHLITHAFFKSALFLSCGILIHGLYDEQDIRRMGKLINFFPTIYLGTIICSLSLMGFPMLSGFFSKDFILESIYVTYTKDAFIIFLLGCLGALLTAGYGIRFIYLIFFNNDIFSKNKIQSSQLVVIPRKMVYPFYFLTLLAIIIGYFLENIFSSSTLLWNNIIVFNYNAEHYDNEFELTLLVKFLPLVTTILGILCVFYFLKKNSDLLYHLKIYYYKIYVLLSKKFFFDFLYNIFLTKSVLQFSYEICYKLLDKGFLEKLGPFGTNTFIKQTQNNIRHLHNGYIVTYMLLILYYSSLVALCLVFIF